MVSDLNREEIIEQVNENETIYSEISRDDESEHRIVDTASPDIENLTTAYIINPDDDPPSIGHYEKFKALYYNFHSDKWDVFEEAVAEFTRDAQKFVKIDTTIKGTYKPRSMNANDPTIMQRLYRRNRRRAMRTVQGGETTACKVSHND